MKWKEGWFSYGTFHSGERKREFGCWSTEFIYSFAKSCSVEPSLTIQWFRHLIRLYILYRMWNNVCISHSIRDLAISVHFWLVWVMNFHLSSSWRRGQWHTEHHQCNLHAMSFTFLLWIDIYVVVYHIPLVPPIPVKENRVAFCKLCVIYTTCCVANDTKYANERKIIVCNWAGSHQFD